MPALCRCFEYLIEITKSCDSGANADAKPRSQNRGLGHLPVKFPDFYGIDTPKPDELVASSLSVEEIRQQIGADSLAYLPYDGMIQATGLPESRFSTSCFSGIYPVEIGDKPLEALRR